LLHFRFDHVFVASAIACSTERLATLQGRTTDIASPPQTIADSGWIRKDMKPSHTGNYPGVRVTAPHRSASLVTYRRQILKKPVDAASVFPNTVLSECPARRQMGTSF